MSQEGLTLLEILVAVFIIALVIGAITFITPMLLGRKTDNNTYAYNAARQGIEAYRSYWSIYNNFKDGTTPPNIGGELRAGCTMATPTVMNFALVNDGKSFILSPLSTSTTIPDIRRVSITVSCPKTANITLQTEIADPTVDVK